MSNFRKGKSLILTTELKSLYLFRKGKSLILTTELKSLYLLLHSQALNIDCVAFPGT